MSKERKVLIIVENLPVPFDTRVWQEATTLADVCVNSDTYNSMNDKSTMNKILEYT